MAIKRSDIQAEVEKDLEKLKPLTKNVDGEVKEYDDNDYNSWIQTTTEGRYQEAAFGYKELRRDAYGDVADQLDEIYKSIDNGDFGEDAKSSDWYLRIKKVKTDNPKPS
tara:strand:+ start:2682 stop:3008 length:327 start_codon:yes stop_codon:yes gene_type:complete